MAEPGRATYPEGTAEERTRQSAENPASWMEPETAEALLAKLKNLHAQAEWRSQLLDVHETLHDNERRFREMIDALPAAIYTTDAEGRLTHFNPAAIRLSCRVPDVGSDKWCVSWKLFWPDGTPMPHAESPMALALKKGRAIRDAEIIAERPDGRRLWLSVYPTPLRDAEGRIIGGINMLVDRTEQKRYEAKLRESEERYRVLAGKLDAEARARTKELEERNVEIHEQAERLRLLSNRLMQTQDDERRSIARELHDSVGQYLAALGMSIESARRSIKEIPPQVAEKLDQATEIVGKCSSEIRTLSHLLHPPLLEELGLASAIEWYVEGFALRSNMEVQLQIPPKLRRLEEPVELALFRVLQECLTNIHRHSGSKTAVVTVEADEQQVKLEVSDQGRGILEPLLETRFTAPKRLGVGINGMRERLKGLNGTLEIHSTNLGTTARAIIPLQP
ncbi:MAG: histidine kinase, partial [Candidatus Acidiferrales bacterium]